MCLFVPCLCVFLSFYTVFAGTSYDCDLVVDSSICIKNTQNVILPSARRMGRILHLTFDEEEPVDSSGFENHCTGEISGHSGFGGVGTSAYFRRNFIHLKPDKSFNTNEFSYLFFIYLLMDENSQKNNSPNKYCSVIHKGYRTKLASEATPGISINPNTGQIRVTVSIEANNTIELLSNSRLQHYNWYHIAVVRDRDAILLYVDGILDYKYATRAYTRLNPLPLYIGAAPFDENCDFPILLDELSVFSHAVGRDEIQAEASVALGVVESSYIVIGCIGCGKEESMTSCPEGYHLCNKVELYTGGYQVARKLSLPPNEIMASASAEPSSGIGLCCANLR